eukprot:comp20723_c0_seq1/m.42556 comp20723_c0_seq1/g.42556  ORF comp20723_c0_seq1/g.42556 comp20723_c0_seq1/m.42556 type:complete len:375 (+) comp20723_c0_seq1:266-1390(+)
MQLSFNRIVARVFEIEGIDNVELLGAVAVQHTQELERVANKLAVAVKYDRVRHLVLLQQALFALEMRILERNHAGRVNARHVVDVVWHIGMLQIVPDERCLALVNEKLLALLKRLGVCHQSAHIPVAKARQRPGAVAHKVEERNQRAREHAELWVERLLGLDDGSVGPVHVVARKGLLGEQIAVLREHVSAELVPQRVVQRARVHHNRVVHKVVLQNRMQLLERHLHGMVRVAVQHHHKRIVEAFLLFHKPAVQQIQRKHKVLERRILEELRVHLFQKLSERCLFADPLGSDPNVLVGLGNHLLLRNVSVCNESDFAVVAHTQRHGRRHRSVVRASPGHEVLKNIPKRSAGKTEKHNSSNDNNGRRRRQSFHRE